MTELEFAERLKALRKANNMTQQELADKLGVSNKSVSRWETGGYPDVATLGPLAKVLGVTVDDLLGESPPLRSLERADWQNLLSYAFAIGGGVLFFLFDLFVPTLVCYLLYHEKKRDCKNSPSFSVFRLIPLPDGRPARRHACSPWGSPLPGCGSCPPRRTWSWRTWNSRQTGRH